MSSRVSLTVDDKVQDVAPESSIARWLESMDMPGLSSLVLRPCNSSKATFPASFCDFLKKLCQLVALNADYLHELHFITWPLEAACRKAGIPMIHEILDGLPGLKNRLKAFTYLWQGNDLRGWQPANMSLPTDVINVPLITSMKNLQQLNIASQILTENFLMALTSHANGIKIKVG